MDWLLLPAVHYVAKHDDAVCAEVLRAGELQVPEGFKELHVSTLVLFVAST